MKIVLSVLLATACTGHDPPREAQHEHWCTVRLSAKGMYVDGTLTSRPDAITACKRTAGAVVVLEDGASQDAWRELEAALHREGVETRVRGTLDDTDCFHNPLAKDCQ